MQIENNEPFVPTRIISGHVPNGHFDTPFDTIEDIEIGDYVIVENKTGGVVNFILAAVISVWGAPEGVIPKKLILRPFFQMSRLGDVYALDKSCTLYSLRRVIKFNLKRMSVDLTDFVYEKQEQVMRMIPLVFEDGEKSAVGGVCEI